MKTPPDYGVGWNTLPTTLQRVTVVIHHVAEVEVDLNPQPLSEFVAALSEMLNGVPEEHHPSAMVTFRPQGDAEYGDWSIDYGVTYRRPETDEEYEWRQSTVVQLKAEQAARAEREARANERAERATYKRLQAKYGAARP